MPRIILKKNSSAGSVPLNSELELGELAINTNDGKLFTKKFDGVRESVVEIGGGGTPTGLEALDEGNGIGWRLIGRDPNVYGDIGFQAVDFSYKDPTNEVSTLRGATGQGSTAFGYDTIASNNDSFAVGYKTNANGDHSFAEGNFTSADGIGSHAEGLGTKATGNYSHAEGRNTYAAAYYSHASGSYTTAGYINQFVIGTNNLNKSTTYFEVGNGTGGSGGDDSNAFEVYRTGEIFAPVLTPSLIDNADNKVLVTKEWVQANAGSGGNLINIDNGYGIPEAVDNTGTVGTRAIDFSVNGDGATGTGSLAVGEYNEASGNYAVAFGGYATASGNYSFAVGYGIKASESCSIATGYNTTASGSYSSASGYYTTASGDYSTAFGYYATASGDYSTAFGVNTSASGTNSFAIGYRTVANKESMVAVGKYNAAFEDNQIFVVGIGTAMEDYRNGLEVFTDGRVQAPELSIALIDDANTSDRVLVTREWVQANAGGGNPTGLEALDEGNGIGWRLIGRDPDNYGDIGLNAIDLSYYDQSSTDRGATGTGSFTVGYAVRAQADYSAAFGYSTTAKGNYTITQGYHTTAYATGSHSEGKGTATYADYSHAEGVNTYTYNTGAHSEGYQTNAAAEYSHAEGVHTQASGYASHAEGFYTQTSNDYCHVMGTYNVDTDYTVMQVGIGDSSTRKNAFEVFTDGTLYAPELSTTVINNADPRVLITKEYADANYGGSGGVASLNDIGDVDVAGVTDGQIIQWSAGSSTWLATDLPGGGNLLSDGSVPMDTGYTPVNDQDIATKYYVDNHDVDGGTF